MRNVCIYSESQQKYKLRDNRKEEKEKEEDGVGGGGRWGVLSTAAGTVT